MNGRGCVCVCVGGWVGGRVGCVCVGVVGGWGGEVGGMRETDSDRGSLSTASVGGTGLKTGFNSISFRI